MKIYTVVLAAALATNLIACGKEPAEKEPALSGEQEQPAYDASPRRICSALPATDELGRRLPTHEEAGDEREGKYVALFYWIWHTNFAKQTYACNVSEIVAQYPDAADDYNHPAWGGTRLPTYWWGKPMFGYYRDTDPWVLRKHAEMLCEAGVDVIVFDCTNGTYTWDDSYPTLMAQFKKFREDGVKTPQVAFMLPFTAGSDTRTSLKKLYGDIYSTGRYRDLWFMWKGKPLVIAHDESLDTSNPEEAAIKDFFTFRRNIGDYKNWSQWALDGYWGWLEIAPQNQWYKTADGYEEVTVGVAQNWSAERGLTAMNAPGVFGRSYTNANGHNTNPDAVNWGLNFQEQWDNALKMDPEIIFITGWNEWIMGRFDEWQGQKNAFPDQYSQECSRDIEPMAGGHGDNYYWQMVSNIRRFKGMSPGPAPHEAVPAAGKEWKDLVKLNTGWWGQAETFEAFRGNALKRNHEGWGGESLVNNVANMDICGAKTAHDAENVYMMALTSKNIPSVSCSLVLFLDIDRKHGTGWEGYDYRIIFRGGDAVLYKNAGNSWKWEKAADLECVIYEKALAVKIPRTSVSLGAGAFDVEFKWGDNIPDSCKGAPESFWIYGDLAPLGRFNYLYQGK